jgi:hypothetical protein
MEALQTLEVRRVQSSADLMKAGDYVFIGKREPIRKFEAKDVLPPDGFWRSLLWFFFGKKKKLKEFIEIVWPDYDAVVLVCARIAARLLARRKTTASFHWNRSRSKSRSRAPIPARR